MKAFVPELNPKYDIDLEQTTVYRCIIAPLTSASYNTDQVVHSTLVYYL